jgi:hypothetical protein
MNNGGLEFAIYNFFVELDVLFVNVWTASVTCIGCSLYVLYMKFLHNLMT